MCISTIPIAVTNLYAGWRKARGVRPVPGRFLMRSDRHGTQKIRAEPIGRTVAGYAILTLLRDWG
jgi:hypothetical protein